MFERFTDRVEELAEPQARSADAKQSYQVRSAGVDKHGPPKRKMNDHWELFTNVAIVREAIRAFAGEVTSDGYYIQTDNEEAREELEEWLQESAIVNADVDNDFRKIVEEAIVQQEVRGTALVEVVRDDEDGIYGFKSIRPETVKQYTLPGQSVLLAPDQDTSQIDEDSIVRTDDGEVAAYVQFDDDLFGYNDQDPIGFTRDEVIKFTRDGDVGDPWGISRLDAVKDRVESLLQKLDNNDKAIESLAWKFWLFKFGTEEQPWPQEKIQEFMNHHSADEFEPGMKQGVQGNVDIETVSGEVADIEEYLDFDIDWIISGLPYVKYGLGGFEENVNQFVSRSQEARIKNQVQEARRRYSEGFEPVIKDKAEELGYDPEDIELVIGLSPEERAIRMDTTIGDLPYYPSGGMDAANDGVGDGDSGPDGADYTRPPASSETPGGPEPTRPEARGEENTVWDVAADADVSAEELAVPGVDLEDERSQLLTVGTDALLEVRDAVLDAIEQEFAGSLQGLGANRPQHPRAYRRPAQRAVRTALSKASVQRRSEEPFAAMLEETYDALEEEGVIEARLGQHRHDAASARRFSDTYDMAIRDAAEEMARDITHTVRAGLERGEEFGPIRERVQTEFNEAAVRQTARLISQMELKNSIETTRLREFERADDVIGVRPAGDCRSVSTPLCRRLAGCEGEQAAAYFDEGSIGEQLQEQVSDDLLLKGFDPLPEAPPMHYNCELSLEPIMADTEEAQ